MERSNDEKQYVIHYPNEEACYFHVADYPGTFIIIVHSNYLRYLQISRFNFIDKICRITEIFNINNEWSLDSNMDSNMIFLILRGNPIHGFGIWRICVLPTC